MLINREKYIDEYLMNIEKSFDIIDSLLNCLDEYIINDEIANGNGCGCYCEPQNRIIEMLKEKDIFEYIDV